MQSDLPNLLPDFDVISFDVFDTLLLRPYLKQEDLWFDLGRRRFGEKGGAAFLKARIKADGKTYAAATKRGGEHTLAEAYRSMPKRFVALMAEEEKLQRECLQANPEMLAVWRRAGELGKKRIIVSDMYLSESWFAETLRQKGLGDYDGLYVSSARQARKSTGRLFDAVRVDFPTAKILHVGDNRHSDVEMPDAAGIVGCHYPNFREQILANHPCLQAFTDNFPTFGKRLLMGKMITGWQDFRGRTPAPTYWHWLGFFFGGLLGFQYVTWLAKTAALRGVDHLLFVARDGYLWQRMFERMATGIKTDYFYAPRLTGIKVCGVIGSDPAAIADRRRILDSLPPFDPEVERRQYSDYLSRLEIGGHTAVVDGVSSAFSVQTLVEKAIGRTMPAFYLMSIVPVRFGAALYEHPVKGLQWQQLSEFLFSSPERPIVAIGADGPIYKEEVSADESFRESVFPDLSAGALAGFEVLNRVREDNRQLAEMFGNRQFWLDMVSALVTHMSAEDSRQLARARNAWNVQQDNFAPILVPQAEDVRVTRRFGKSIGVWRGRSTPDAYERTFFAFGRYPVLTRRGRQ